MLKAVVAFAGSRDKYQGALALSETNLLERFVTDLYCPRWAIPWLDKASGGRAAKRHCPGLDDSSVTLSLRASYYDLRTLLSAEKDGRFYPRKDEAISLLAARIAIRSNSALLAYSYYAGAAFSKYGNDLPARLMYQVHPNGSYLRHLYQEDIRKEPFGERSLKTEEEMKARSEYLEQTDAAPLNAQGIICASQFTKKSLLYAGVTAPILVVPYGVDAESFSARTEPLGLEEPFTLVFIGQVNQRKGFIHLLKALRLLGSRRIRLKVFSRLPIGDDFKPFTEGLDIVQYVGISNDEMAREIKRADLFVLPSIAEGFGLVILEAMASGLPVLVTENTAGPDIVTAGEEGFIIPAGDIVALTKKIDDLVSRRDDLYQMGKLARKKAESMTWAAYRNQYANAYKTLVTNLC